MSDPIAASTIVAQAFRLMEMAPVSAFGDTSPEVTDATQQFPVAMEHCLELADWSFASKFAELPQATNLAADPDLPYAYVRPGSLIRLHELRPADARFRLDADALRADQAPPLFVRYTARVENEAMLPASFKQLVSFRLAADLARRWTKSVNRAESLEQGFDRALQAALSSDRRNQSQARYDGLDVDESAPWSRAAIW